MDADKNLYLGTQIEVQSVTRIRLGSAVALRHVAGHEARFPYAPASLWSPRWPPNANEVPVLTFDRILRVEGDIYEYLAFDPTDAVSAGDRLRLQGHFTPWQYVVMLDGSIAWRREPCPFDHDQCTLTWSTIAHGEDAYTMDGYRFISVEAYQRLIVRDPYQLRGDQPPELVDDPDAVEYRRLVESGYRWDGPPQH